MSLWYWKTVKSEKKIAKCNKISSTDQTRLMVYLLLLPRFDTYSVFIQFIAKLRKEQSTMTRRNSKKTEEKSAKVAEGIQFKDACVSLSRIISNLYPSIFRTWSACAGVDPTRCQHLTGSRQELFSMLRAGKVLLAWGQHKEQQKHFKWFSSPIFWSTWCLKERVLKRPSMYTLWGLIWVAFLQVDSDR